MNSPTFTPPDDNNTEIRTFQMFIYHPPTQLGSPLMGWNGPAILKLVNMKGQRVLTRESHLPHSLWASEWDKGSHHLGTVVQLAFPTDGDGRVNLVMVGCTLSRWW